MSLLRATLVVALMLWHRAEAGTGYHHHQHQQRSASYEFAGSEQKPIVSSKTTYNGCTSATGCGGVTLENGKVVHKYGNPAAIGLPEGAQPEQLDARQLHDKFALQASDVNAAFAGGIPATGPFWWANENSPFKDAHAQYTEWIKNGFAGVSLGAPCGLCASGAAASRAGEVNGAIASNSIDIANNPFLNGRFAAAFSGSGSNAASGAKAVDISNNPFLNGNIKMPPFTGTQHTSSFQTHTAFEKPVGLNLANNPFLNGVVSGAGCSGPSASGATGNCGASAVLQQSSPSGCGGSGCSSPSGFVHQSGSVSTQSSPGGCGPAGCGSTKPSSPGGCGSAGCGTTSGFVQQSGSVSTQDYNSRPTAPGGCGPAGCGTTSGFVQQTGSVSSQDYNSKLPSPGGCGPAGCGTTSGFIQQTGSVSSQDYNSKPSSPGGCGPAGCGTTSGFIQQTGSVSSQDYNSKPSSPGGCGPAGCGTTSGFIQQTGSVSSQDYNSKPSSPGGCGPAGCGTTSGFIQQTGSVSSQGYNSKPSSPGGCGPAGCGTTSGFIQQTGSVSTQDYNRKPSTPSGFIHQSGSVYDQQQQQQVTDDFGQQTQKPFPNVPHPPGATNGGFRGEAGADGELTVSCNGADRVCVQKYLCVNGFVNEDGENIVQFREFNECKTSSETCCRLRPKPSGNAIDSASLQSTVSKQVVSGAGGQYEESFYTRPGSDVSLKPGVPYLPPDEPAPTTQPPRTQPPYVPPKTERPYVPPSTTQPPRTPPPYIPPKTERPYVPPPTPTQPPRTPPPYIPPKTERPYVPPPTPTQPPRTPPPYIPPKTERPYVPPSTTQPPRTQPPPYKPPPYLPPKEDEKPQSSIGSQQIVPGPQTIDYEGSLLLDQTRNPPTKPPAPRPSPPPRNFDAVPVVHQACAAALKCTPIELCTAEGVISNTTVILTKEQAEFRVPMTDCKDLDTGVVGKCCRDPTYTDPWPTNQLGQWVPGAFGDTGAYRAENHRNGGKNNNGNGNRINGNGPSSSGSAGVRADASIIRPNVVSNPNRPPPNTKTPPKKPNTFAPPQPRPTPPESFGTGQLQLANFSPPKCGVRKPGFPPGNKNNLEVDFGEIPWQAMVLLETNRSLLCGGTITEPNAVITSASCIDGLEPRSIMVKGGEWKLGIDEEPKPFQIVRVSNVIKHPAYQPGNLQYDLAILMLEENLRYADNINQICLPQFGAPEVHQKKTQCITTGWGKQVLQVNIPNSIMHSVDMNILSPQQCQGQISQNYPHLLEQYNQNNCICGQPLKGNICKVDIGSALACTGPDGSYYMEGVYSWDSGCTSPVQIASFFKFDAQWYENAMESRTSGQRGQSQIQSQSQRFETAAQQQHTNQIYKRQYETAQIAQPTQIHTYAVSGHDAFNQAVGVHRPHHHTGADCHCLPGNGGKK